MSDKPQDSKAPEAQKTEQINLRVVNQTDEQIYFKIKVTTPIGKLMAAYCVRKGVSEAAVRFLYDGKRLQPTDTPAALGMEDQDVIDVVVQQIGGFY